MGERYLDSSVLPLEENLKKALTELLILHFLSEREYYIGELTASIREKSQDILNIVFPYAAIYRLLDDDYIIETRKRIAPDGRRRQYYYITEKGQAYLRQLKETYFRFSLGVANVLQSDGGQSCEAD